MEERKICDLCKGLGEFIEKCHEGIYGDQRVGSLQDLEDFLSGRDCVEHYICMPLLRLRGKREQ